MATVHKTRCKVVENPQGKPSPPLLYPQRPMFWPPPHASWRTRPPSFVFLYAMRYAVSCSVPKHSPRARVTMCHLDPGRFQTPALENQQRCEQPRPSPQAVSPRCRPEAALPQPKGLTVPGHHARCTLCVPACQKGPLPTKPGARRESVSG